MLVTGIVSSDEARGGVPHGGRIAHKSGDGVGDLGQPGLSNSHLRDGLDPDDDDEPPKHNWRRSPPDPRTGIPPASAPTAISAATDQLIRSGATRMKITAATALATVTSTFFRPLICCRLIVIKALKMPTSRTPWAAPK